MASIEARVKKLEKKALSHEKTVKKLKADGMGPYAIAKALGIGRASVNRALG